MRSRIDDRPRLLHPVLMVEVEPVLCLRRAPVLRDLRDAEPVHLECPPVELMKPRHLGHELVGELAPQRLGLRCCRRSGRGAPRHPMHDEERAVHHRGIESRNSGSGIFIPARNIASTTLYSRSRSDLSRPPVGSRRPIIGRGFGGAVLSPLDVEGVGFARRAAGNAHQVDDAQVARMRHPAFEVFVEAMDFAGPT